MAFTRRKMNRRTNRRRRRYNRLKYGKKNSTRINKLGVHYFKRHVTLTDLKLSAGASTDFDNLVFSLDNVTGYTEFTALYDFYRINAVKVSFIPVSNVSLWSDTDQVVFRNTEFANRLFTVIDYNDGTALTTINEAREYRTCKWTPYTRIHKRYFHPTPVYHISSSDNNIAQVRKAWISCADPTVQYYGIKTAYDGRTNTTMNAETIYKIECVYYMQFKNPK